MSDVLKQNWMKLQHTNPNVRRILFNYPLDRQTLHSNIAQTQFVQKKYPFWNERAANGDLPVMPVGGVEVDLDVAHEYDIDTTQFLNKDLVYSEKSAWAWKSHSDLNLYKNPTNIPFSKMKYLQNKNPRKWESSVKWFDVKLK